MYQVSNDFSTAIKNNARFIKSYFTLDGVSYDIRTLTIDDFIYADGNFIGTFIAKNGTIKLNRIDNLNLEDKKIKVFIGVKTINGFEYVPMGTYKIYESIENDEYKIIDYRYKFNIPFDSSKMFYPTTPLKLLQEACKQAGVLLNTNNFPNKDLDIPNEVFFGYDAKCADVITAVAQASCSIAKIDRDDRLILKWFTTASFAIDLDHQTKKPNTNDVYGPINTVVLSNEPQTDSIYYPKELPLNVKEVKIVNNPLLGVDRTVSIVPFYNRINGFSYVPYTTSSQGYFHLDACDIVKLQLNDKTYIDAVIMNQTIVFKGGISSSFESPALSKAQMDFAMADNTDKKIYETELYVDRVAGEIKSEVKSVSSQVYRFETGNWNIFKNCNKELSTGSVSDMELDITKSYIRSKDICISCGIDVSDANYNVGAAGAYFDVSYMDNTIQRIETKWVPGQPTIDYLIDSCTSITKRIFTHYKVQDKEIKSVSNLTLYSNVIAKSVKINNPKVEMGTYPTGYEFDVPYIRDNVTTLDKQFTALDQKVGYIALQSTSLTQEVSTIKGNVTTLETRMQSTELKLTPTNITAMVNEKIGADGSIKTTKVTIDKTGLSVYGGGISIYNNANQKVFFADNDGNLTLSAHITYAQIDGANINISQDARIGNILYLGSVNDKATYRYISLNGSAIVPSSEVSGNMICYGEDRVIISAEQEVSLSNGPGVGGGGVSLNMRTGFPVFEVFANQIKMNGTVIHSSDIRKKNSIQEFDENWIDDLHVFEFKYNGNQDRQIGLIAQEYINKPYSDYFLNVGKDGYYGIAYGNITNALIKYAQVSRKEIRDLAMEVAKLKGGK